MVFRLIKDTYSSRYFLLMMELKNRLSDSERLFFPLPKFIFLFSISLQVTHFIHSIYEYECGLTFLDYGSWPLQSGGKGAERRLRIVKQQ